MKKYVLILSLLLLLTACSRAGDMPPRQTDDVQTSLPERPQQPDNIPASLPELETPGWQALSTDPETFDLNGSFDNPNFTYVFDHTDTVPLDQLAAFVLAADGASEGACEELRSRFLEAPNTVLTYLALLGDQVTELSGWEPALTAELLCRFIASADAAWHGGSEEFASTMAQCREAYPEGRIAGLLDVLEAEHAASMERNSPNP